jgi:hypothetical protein
MQMATTTTRKVGLYGKALPQFPTGLKDLSAYLTSTGLPAPPASVNHYSAVSVWPMDGNDQYGDCTMAAAAHCIQMWDAVTNTTDPVPSEAAVVQQYLKLTGGPDTGLVEANVLKTWMTTGLWNNVIAGYAPVNVHNLTLLQQVIYLYGGAYVGIQVPANAETQFGNHHPWTLDPGWQHEKMVGGHAIPLVGYDANYIYAITWGAVQPMAYDWWHTYGDEAWAILPDEFKEAGGFDGINVAALQGDLKSV